MPLDNFPKNLKYLRNRAHLSQEQMAEVLDLSRACLGSWEEGRCFPNVPKLVELCDRLGIEDLRLILTKSMREEEGDGEVESVVRRLRVLKDAVITDKCPSIY